jgi:hypothetical protein
MKNRLTNLLLSIALKDIASLLRFFGKLEGKLAEFAAAQQAEIDAIDAEIVHLASEKAALAGDLTLAQALRNGVSQLRGNA